jgi:nucleoside-diphosphate-sugar epimerase
MRVLVTGANGFIGKALIKALYKQGHHIMCTFREGRITDPNLLFPVSSPECQTAWIPIGNIDHRTDWHEALEDTESVIHLAARSHLRPGSIGSSLSELREVNTHGTLNLARQAAHHGARRFIFISSIGVNGNQTISKPFSEQDIPNPSENYTLSKYEAEVGLERIAQETGMEVVIIRPPLVYGPNPPGNIARLVRLVQTGLPLPFGAIENRRSLVALDNLTDFISTCMTAPKAANELFLISDGEDITTPQLLRKLAHAYQREARLILVPVNWMELGAKLLGKEAIAIRLLRSLVIDSSKARNLLGWQPVITMDEQLRRMASSVARL